MQGMIAPASEKQEKPQAPPTKTKPDANEVSADAKMPDGSFQVANAAIVTDLTRPNASLAMEEAIDLDEMISQSICAVENADLRKRLASQIILVGGVAKTDKIVEWVEDNVFNRIRETEYDESIECVEVLLVNLQQQQQVLLQQ